MSEDLVALVRDLASRSQEDYRGDISPDCGPLFAAYEKLRGTSEGDRYAAAVGDLVGHDNWITSLNVLAFIAHFPDTSASDQMLRYVEAHRDFMPREALAAVVAYGNKRGITAARREIGRAGRTTVSNLMQVDRDWTLSHFNEALTEVPVSGFSATVPNVPEWPRRDIVPLLQAKSVYLKQLGRMFSGNRTYIFFADDTFFYVSGSEMAWWNETEFADIVATIYPDPVDTKIFAPYSKIPANVLEETSRRKRAVEATINELTPDRWLNITSDWYLRHDAEKGWHTIQLSSGNLTDVVPMTIAGARDAIFRTSETPAVVPASVRQFVDTVFSFTSEAIETLKDKPSGVEEGFVVYIAERYFLVQSKDGFVTSLERMLPDEVRKKLLHFYAAGIDVPWLTLPTALDKALMQALVDATDPDHCLDQIRNGRLTIRGEWVLMGTQWEVIFEDGHFMITSPGNRQQVPESEVRAVIEKGTFRWTQFNP